MSNPEHTARVIARVFLGALDSAALAAGNDPDAQRFVADIRDQLKPELDWMMRYDAFIDERDIDDTEFDTEPDPTREW